MNNKISNNLPSYSLAINLSSKNHVAEASRSKIESKINEQASNISINNTPLSNTKRLLLKNLKQASAPSKQLAKVIGIGLAILSLAGIGYALTKTWPSPLPTPTPTPTPPPTAAPTLILFAPNLTSTPTAAPTLILFDPFPTQTPTTSPIPDPVSIPPAPTPKELLFSQALILSEKEPLGIIEENEMIKEATHLFEKGEAPAALIKIKEVPHSNEKQKLVLKLARYYFENKQPLQLSLLPKEYGKYINEQQFLLRLVASYLESNDEPHALEVFSEVLKGVSLAYLKKAHPEVLREIETKAYFTKAYEEDAERHYGLTHHLFEKKQFTKISEYLQKYEIPPYIQELLQKVYKLSNLNAYIVLGVSPGSTWSEIQKAYRKLSLKLHPDKCKEDGCANQFVAVVNAYDAIKKILGKD